MTAKDRREYFRTYHAAHRDERNQKSRIRNKGRKRSELTLEKEKEWKRRNSLALKIRRELGLRTIAEARALLERGAR